MGAGKSTASQQLVQDLSAPLVSVDGYASTEAGELPYLRRLRLASLTADLAHALSDAGVVIVEGICVLDVLDAIGMRANLLVYVKRVTTHPVLPLWHDGFHLEDYERDGPLSATENGLYRDEVEYHVRRRPHELADVVYERKETSDG